MARFSLLLLLFSLLPSRLLASDGPPPPYSAPTAGGFAGLPVPLSAVAVELGAPVPSLTRPGGLATGRPIIDFAAEQKPRGSGRARSGSSASASTGSHMSDTAAALTGQPTPVVSLGFDPKTGRITGSLSEFVSRSLQSAPGRTRRGGRRDAPETQVLVEIARVFDESNRLQSEANRIQAERLQRRKRELRAQRAKQAADQQANERADRINRCAAITGAATALIGTSLSVLSLYWQFSATTNQ